MKKPKYFCSYSTIDRNFAVKIASDFKKAGVDIWIDLQDIPAGVPWDIAIQKALEDVDGLIVVLSKSSVSSPNVLDEISFALKYKKTIFPLLLEDCKIPLRLNRIQYVDFRGDYPLALQKLLHTVEGTILSIKNPSPKGKNKKKLAILGTVGLLTVIALGVFFVNLRWSYSAPKNTIPLFVSKNYEGRYLIKDKHLLLLLYSPSSWPNITFDVNQNQMVDSRYDRVYGTYWDNSLCSSYLLDNKDTKTVCSGAPSDATVSKREDEFLFTIPLKEITTSHSISLKFSFYNERFGPTFCPDSSFGGFSRTYKILF